MGEPSENVSDGLKLTLSVLPSENSYFVAILGTLSQFSSMSNSDSKTRDEST